MDDGKIVRPDFTNHKLCLLPDMTPGADVEAGSNVPEKPPATGRTENRTTDGPALERGDSRHADAGVRIREYAITPGRILQALEKVIAAEETGGNMLAVR